MVIISELLLTQPGSQVRRRSVISAGIRYYHNFNGAESDDLLNACHCYFFDFGIEI